MDYSRCSGCPLDGTVKPSEMTDNKNARFLVVTDTPSFDDAARGRLLSPEAMSVFSSHMKQEGFGKNDFAFVPQIRCAHEADTFTSAQKKDIAHHCRAHLLQDIEVINAQAILPLGAEASKQVAGKAVKITKVRGAATYSEEHKTNIFPMISPMQVALYPQNEPIFAADCKSFGRLLDNDFDVKEASRSVGGGKYEYIDDLEFLIKQNPKVIAYDTETTSLRWYAPDAKILSMQFCLDSDPERAYLLPWAHPQANVSDRRRAQLKKQFIRLMCKSDVKLVGQNLKYDVTMTHAGLGVKLKIGGDTLMMAVLLDENAYTKSLDMLVKRYFPEMSSYSDYFDANVDKTNMISLPLDQEFLNYSCGDSYVAYHLNNILLEMVSSDKKLLAHYNHVSLPGLNMFAAVEMRGLHVDYEALDEFERRMEESVKNQYMSLIQKVPKSIKRKHIQIKKDKEVLDEKGINRGLKFTRGEFIRDILFYHEDGFKLTPRVFTDSTAKLPEHLRVPSTSSKDHLPFFFDECPFAAWLAEYIKDERLLNTNIVGFKNKYIHDNLVRGKYSLTTAVTGRTASSDPNSQNAPKRGENAIAYRRVYVAPPDHFIVGADQSQIEMRIAAHYANEQVMLRIYQEGGDIHKLTGAMALGMTIEEFLRQDKKTIKSARQKAKAIGFGYIFGMWWRKFILYAKTQYGVEFTDREAKLVREGFFKLYPGLAPWHEKVKEHARKHKQIQGLTGRIRHLPMIDSSEEWIRQEAERQAVNSPVQGVGSDVSLIAMGELHEEIDDRYLAPVAFIHDYVGCYVPKEYLLWGAQTIKTYMEGVSDRLKEYWGVTLKCPLVAEASFGINMGDEYELEGLTIDGEYDFTQFEEDILDDKGNIIRAGIIAPPQEIPPNDGRRVKPYYTEV